MEHEVFRELCDGKVFIFFQVDKITKEIEHSSVHWISEELNARKNFLKKNDEQTIIELYESGNVKDALFFEAEMMYDRFVEENGCERLFTKFTAAAEYNDRRMFASFIYLRGMLSKKEFDDVLKNFTDLSEMESFMLQDLLWTKGMISVALYDFMQMHKCSNVKENENPQCLKYSLLKCSVCKVARYCSVQCQEMHFESHLTECNTSKKVTGELSLRSSLRKEKRMRRALIQMWDESSGYRTGLKDPRQVKRLDQDVLSSRYFLSRIRMKKFELIKLYTNWSSLRVKCQIE